jgi:hypothetical protein
MKTALPTAGPETGMLSKIVLESALRMNFVHTGGHVSRRLPASQFVESLFVRKYAKESSGDLEPIVRLLNRLARFLK